MTIERENIDMYVYYYENAGELEAYACDPALQLANLLNSSSTIAWKSLISRVLMLPT